MARKSSPSTFEAVTPNDSTDDADVQAAKRLGAKRMLRAELLAELFNDAPNAIGVAGTSGKSTVVAMTFEILRGAGREPSVITGGDLVALQREGLGPVLVVEERPPKEAVVDHQGLLTPSP